MQEIISLREIQAKLKLRGHQQTTEWGEVFNPSSQARCSRGFSFLMCYIRLFPEQSLIQLLLPEVSAISVDCAVSLLFSEHGDSAATE